MNTEAIIAKLQEVKRAHRAQRGLDTTQKNAVLYRLEAELRASEGHILAANQADLAALSAEKSPAFRDRLTLNSERIKAMCEGVKLIGELKDPVGVESDHQTLRSGIRAHKVQSPLGILLIIFESRPNVAIEAFALAFKSSNAVILRGGTEALQTLKCLYSIIDKVLIDQAIDPALFWGIQDPARSLSQALLKQNHYIDVVIPRGGDSLIQFVVKESTIPMIKNDRGMCHIYIDKSADLKIAAAVVQNAKTSRPVVCNAMETLLIHRSIAPTLLPTLSRQLSQLGVQWFCCNESLAHMARGARFAPAHAESWDTEYLDLKINCRIVDSLDQALDHIELHGSKHSEAIITTDAANAKRFLNEVDAAATYWNASTRFTDGYEMGLGAEIGISTQKLHVRGPVGLRELTSSRWILTGTGEIR